MVKLGKESSLAYYVLLALANSLQATLPTLSLQSMSLEADALASLYKERPGTRIYEHA